jgi:hypothetical protein
VETNSSEFITSGQPILKYSISVDLPFPLLHMIVFKFGSELNSEAFGRRYRVAAELSAAAQR